MTPSLLPVQELHAIIYTYEYNYCSAVEKLDSITH